MKATDLVGSAARNTLRSKLRTTLTVLALFIGAFTLTLTTAVGAGVTDYVTKQVASLGADDVFIVTRTAGDTTEGPRAYDPKTSSASSATGGPALPGAGQSDPMTEADLEKLAGISGISRFDPVQAVAVDYVDALGFSDAQDAVGAVVQLGITDVLGARHQVDGTVVGISQESLLSSGGGANPAMVSALAEAQSAGIDTGPARYPLAVAYFDPALSSAQVSDLQESVAAAGFGAQTIQDQLGVIKTVIDGIIGVLNAFAIVALVAAAFGIVNTLLMSVQERTREIGLMKSMGMRAGKIFALFSLEAAFIGFLGSLIGVAAAVLAGSALNAALSAGPLSSLPGLNILLFEPGAIMGIMLLIMAIAFISGTLPASRAARKNPIDSLRYE
ncbi:FtsX-like permease family protein [Arthrobacter sp. KFRI-F3372]|nr:FtsX-like permease family protein [Arthrobacter sp. KFRI-F3372]